MEPLFPAIRRGLAQASRGGLRVLHFWFEGWRIPISLMKGASPVVAPRTWLAAVGWRRHGLIHPDERPAPACGRR